MSDGRWENRTASTPEANAQATGRTSGPCAPKAVTEGGDTAVTRATTGQCRSLLLILWHGHLGRVFDGNTGGDARATSQIETLLRGEFAISSGYYASLPLW